MKHITRFLCSLLFGGGCLLIPLEWRGRKSVLFEHGASWILQQIPAAIQWWALFLMLAGGACSLVACASRSHTIRQFDFFRSRGFLFWTRWIGIAMSVIIICGHSAWFGATDGETKIIWGTLIPSISLVVPIGSILISLLVSYGALEFVGTLMRPLMRPLFKLPGRAALDDLTSWLGPYSLGLYMTRRLFLSGIYTRREAFMVATCFSTVSISFLGVVCKTLDLLAYFAPIMLCYFLAVYLLAIILIRLWPITTIPATFYEHATPDVESEIPLRDIPRHAMRSALARAATAPNFSTTITQGFTDGLLLTATILGSILAVGLMALVIGRTSSIFVWIGLPFRPLLELFHFQDAALLSQALASGLIEVFLPSLFAKSASLESRFFIAFASLSQILFFSSVIGMTIELFRDIPIRMWQLVVLFFLRTLLLIPIGAGLIGLMKLLHVL